MSVALAEVRGLHDFWKRATGQDAPAPAGQLAEWMMLDALGLGIGQVYARMRDQPDWESFAAWIVEMAGKPNPVAIARYHAALDGGPLPPEITERIAAIDAMPPVLDADALAHWDEHGYVVLRGAASPEQAAAAAELLYGIAGGRPDDPDSWFGKGGGSIMVEHFQAPILTEIRANPRIHKAFAQLYGTADLWTQVDRLSFNPPVRNVTPGLGTRLHWDVSLIPPIPLFVQGIMYLTDTAADQGALELVPGFHRRLVPWLAELGPDADPRTIDLSNEAITVGAGAGDMVLWHQALPHSPSPNRAALPRLAHYLAMYPPTLERREEWR